MSEMKTVKLHGQLGSKFGRVHRFIVNSPAEAVHAMACQFVGFEAYMNEAKSRGMGFSVFVGKKNVTKDQLTDLVGSEEIRIVCVPLGAKRAGWLQVILGVVLIVVGAFTSWSGGTALIQLGVSMVIGGVLQLLTPIPKGQNGDRGDSNASYVFNGPANTQAQGNPVPICYGEMTVGSAVVSAGIRTSAEQNASSNGGVTVKIGGISFGDVDIFVNEEQIL